MRRGSVRHRSLGVLLAVLTLPAVLAACVGNAVPPAPQPLPTDGRPNIVFILTDDLSMNLLPYMPHVQGLARSGTSFSNYFVVDSLCCPSRAAILTGLYPHNNGVWSNHAPDGGYPQFEANHNEGKSFGLALQKAGYYTGFLGKYLNMYRPEDPVAPGWDVWDVPTDGYSEYNYTVNENGSIRTYGHDPEDYLTTMLSGRAVDFIHASQYTGKPFALEVSTFAPHRPFVPAPADRNTFPLAAAPRTASFAMPPIDGPAWISSLPPLSSTDLETIDSQFQARVESVQAVDRLVGQVERALAATGRLDNTYIVFSSDNGFHMGEHNLMPGKQTAYDTDIRVPLVVAGPGVPADRTVDAMTSSVDLAPTLLELAKAQPAAAQDGVSMLDLWHGQPPPADWQSVVLVEHRGPVVQLDDPDIQSSRAGNPPSYEAMRTATFLYVEYVTGEREYYDLVADPHETVNIVDTLSTERLAELHAMLASLQTCSGSAACKLAAAPAGL